MNSGEIDKRIIQVMDLSDEGKYEEALKGCEAIIQIDANYDRVYFERGMIYLNQEKNELARLDFEKLMSINPTYPGGKSWYATTLTDLGRLSESAAIQLEVLRSNQDGDSRMGVSPTAWAECAETYVQLGHYHKAQEVLDEYFHEYEQKVTSYKHSETNPMRVYARLLLKTNKKEFALAKAKKAIESDFTVPSDYEVYIEALVENNQIGSAKIEIERYVSEIHHGFETQTIIELQEKIHTLETAQ